MCHRIGITLAALQRLFGADLAEGRAGIAPDAPLGDNPNDPGNGGNRISAYRLERTLAEIWRERKGGSTWRLV